jgi:hypothetical protein
MRPLSTRTRTLYPTSYRAVNTSAVETGRPFARTTKPPTIASSTACAAHRLEADRPREAPHARRVVGGDVQPRARAVAELQPQRAQVRRRCDGAVTVR